MAEIEIKLHGKVQGVGFRQFAKKQADELDLTGYIQNHEEGNVEIVVQGEKEDLAEFIGRIQRGPVFADVRDTKVIWHHKPQDAFMEFEIW